MKGERFAAEARITRREERTALFDRMVAAIPRLTTYRAATDRRIPVIALRRVLASSPASALWMDRSDRRWAWQSRKSGGRGDWAGLVGSPLLTSLPEVPPSTHNPYSRLPSEDRPHVELFVPTNRPLTSFKLVRFRLDEKRQS